MWRQHNNFFAVISTITTRRALLASLGMHNHDNTGINMAYRGQHSHSCIILQLCQIALEFTTQLLM